MADLPAKTTTALSPKGRLDHDKKVEAEFETVRNLISEKHYSTAFRKLKWVLANSRERSYFYYWTVRDLLKHYPPAKVAAKRWRNDKERLILAQRADRDLIAEWTELNELLREQKRTYEVLYKVAQTTNSADYRLMVIKRIWERLAKRRKYEMLKICIQDLAFGVLLRAHEFDCETLFPAPTSSRELKRWRTQSNLDYMRDEGCLSYEVALGLGEKKVAAVLAKKILSVETNDAMFARLIKAAIRAKDYEEAVRIYQLARETFTKRRLSKSTKMLKSMPKTRLAKFAGDVGL